MRIPFVGSLILNNVSYQSLVNCKRTSRELAKFLDQEKLLSLRIIQKYNGSFQGFEEVWRKVIHKSPIDVIRKLALALCDFAKSHCQQLNLWHPLHIAAANGSLELCIYIVEKIGNKSIPLTALHFAAERGHLEICIFIAKNVKETNLVIENGSSDTTGGHWVGHGCQKCTFEPFVTSRVWTFGGISLQFCQHFRQKSPLHFAAFYGYLEIDWYGTYKVIIEKSRCRRFL